MSVGAVLDRVDDWINPIVVKELRQAVKSRLVVAVLLLFLGLQVLIIFAFLLMSESRTGDPMDWHAGGQVFPILQGILLGTCMLAIPIYSAIRMAAERVGHNVDLLFISTLRPSSIIAGKVVSALVLALLIFSACAPFMTFCYLLRGIDIPTILLVFGADLLATLLAIQFVLFAASVPAPLLLKVVLLLLALPVLLILFYLGAAAGYALQESGAASLLDHPPWEYWSYIGLTTLVVLTVVGQLFTWSVALISPTTSNRAWPTRLFLLGLATSTGAAVMAITSYFSGGSASHIPVTMWMVLCSLLFSLQFLISVNERDHWGPRVARSIPRWWVFRPVAFLFYSGAAGGMTFAVLGGVLVLVAAYVWREAFPSYGGTDGGWIATKVMALIALYTYCYGVSGVLVRTYLLSDKLPGTFTWLVSFVLVGLGSAVPSFAAFIMFFNDARGWSDQFPWWNLPNPIGAVYMVGWESWGSYNDDFEVLCFWFMAIWAAFVSVLAVPWYFSQVLNFHPPARKAAKARVEKEDEVVLAELVPLEQSEAR